MGNAVIINRITAFYVLFYGNICVKIKLYTFIIGIII